MYGMWQRWRQRRACFHHDHRTGESWIKSHLVDLGRRKLFRCTSCAKVWIV
jgi:hypothetical protein